MVQAGKRKVEVLIISDVHLGTYGCQSKALLSYLNGIVPDKVILNGDIIDIWQFKKRYWPKSHMKVVRKFLKWASQGIPIHYITGNHDELLRKFAGFQMGSLSIENKLLLELDGKKVWIFHGDVFDFTMQNSRWLTRLGSHGYDLLIHINSLCNWFFEKMGRGKVSISKKIKNSVKQAVKFINNFELIAAEIAIRNGYDYVVCGHIHHPEIKCIETETGSVFYLNSGDWIENLTALEYQDGAWTLYRHPETNELHPELNHVDGEDDLMSLDQPKIFQLLVEEFSGIVSFPK